MGMVERALAIGGLQVEEASRLVGMLFDHAVPVRSPLQTVEEASCLGGMLFREVGICPSSSFLRRRLAWNYPVPVRQRAGCRGENSWGWAGRGVGAVAEGRVRYGAGLGPRCTALTTRHSRSSGSVSPWARAPSG